ncbi:MAG TPA: monofunctional biosynthetic peptidoglycan transglycosylase, partial [Methylomirabilota bacterium]|nr:monofunctional biosynthetic peptidoglycan transglycosylase [Methylomirabilota bacterium]
ARHPSETDERLMMRLLAFALNVPADDHDGGLEFGKGLSDTDEPDLWQRDLTGRIVHWVDVGQPDERRLLRAAGRADRVAWAWTPYPAISPALTRAVLVAEDIAFFSHNGFALAEIQSALEDAVRDRELPRGASTITQQLAKNLWLSPSRSPLRKAREALLTWQLERALSKRRILELYLNVAEFGPGVYGVGAASRRYFGKAAADLDESEAAQLAAALPNPATWHPGAGTAAYRRHVSAIERRMGRAAFLWKQI